jgi:hypothetical protein
MFTFGTFYFVVSFRGYDRVKESTLCLIAVKENYVLDRGITSELLHRYN